MAKRPAKNSSGAEVVIPYCPRPLQRELHDALMKYRWGVVVCHRRWGKTVWAINHLLMRAMTTGNNARFAYFAPFLKQAKSIAWDYLKHFSRPIPGVAFNETELRVDYPNGARIRLLGADNPDSMRGVYLDGVVLDEYAQMQPSLFTEILRPALSDRKGWAVWMGCVEENTRVLTRQGFRRIKEFSVGSPDKTLDSIDLDLYGANREFHQADGFWNNGLVETRKIRTGAGFEMEASLIHPVLVMGENGVPAWVRLSDLKVGDYVAIARGMDVWAWKDPLDGFEQHLKDFRSTANGNTAKMSGEFKMTPDLAYFMGLWVAEGSIESKTNRITITCGDVDVIDSIVKNKLFGMNFIQRRKDQVRCTSSELVELMRYIEMPLTKAPEKHIPDWVFNSTKEIACSFVAGMWDGDGHIHANRLTAGYTTTSERLAKDLQLLLSNIGIISHKLDSIAAPTKRVKVESTQYHLEVRGSEDILLFKDNIRLRIKRKQEALNKKVKATANFTKIVPYQLDLMERVFKSWITKKGSGNVGHVMVSTRRKGNIGYNRLSEFCKIMDKRELLSEGKADLAILKNNINENYFWNQVKSIIPSQAVTYDFTIPETHSFWSNGFISHNTPKGKGLFYDLYMKALDDPNWIAASYKASETGIVAPEELASARLMMSPDEYQQEYENSWQAALKGAYFATELADARAQGRVTGVPHVSSLQVDTWWDLGMDDATAIWFTQNVGREIHVIDYYEGSGEGLAHYRDVLDRLKQERGYHYGTHYGPHDLAVRELGTGKSRVETAAGMGLKMVTVPRVEHKADAIQAARNLLSQVWIDETRCARGILCLDSYRKEWDDKLQVFREKPLHDFASHAADALMTLARGHQFANAPIALMMPPVVYDTVAGY